MSQPALQALVVDQNAAATFSFVVVDQFGTPTTFASYTANLNVADSLFNVVLSLTSSAGIVLAPGSGATATASVSGGQVSLAVTSGGSLYSSANLPIVIIDPPCGAGTGAAAVAIVSGGAVSGFTLSSAGSGYTSVPNVVIAPPIIVTFTAAQIATLSVPGDYQYNLSITNPSGVLEYVSTGPIEVVQRF